MTKFFYLVFRVSKWKGKREGGRSGQKILPDDFERINASSRERDGFVTKSAR